MQVKTGHTRPGSPLTSVLPEIAKKLTMDDWIRCATADDSSFYYIVGMKAHSDEETGGADHMSLSIPHGAPVSVLGEYQVHGQVASPRSSDYYLRHAISRLVSCGVDKDLLSRFVEADFAKGESFDLSFLHGHVDKAGTEIFEAFSELLQAMVLAKGMELEATEAEKRSELGTAVQKVYLQELSQLYGKVVERATSLNVLNFSDPQLNEASRCYLYGFFRGAVILSASSLEHNLRVGIGQEGEQRVQILLRDPDNRRGLFNLLVDEALSQGLLGERVRIGEEPYLAGYARKLFSERNKVVHEGHNPSAAIAEELVTNAREIVEYVRERLAQNGHEA